MSKRKSILITGCSTGIGAHCAARLHEDGFDVHATARKPEDLERLRLAGMKAYYLEHREPNSIAALVNDVLTNTSGKLYAVFNNAGYAQPGAVEDVPMDALREQMEVNFFAYHDIMRRVVPVMRAQGYGRIINCSSVLGRCALPWRGAYTSSKFALEGLSITLRQELDGSGVFVSLIEPGPIPSNIMVTGASYVDKYIDVEGSPLRQHFQPRLDELRRAEPPADVVGAEPVYKALRHALNAKRPKPHYPVTIETRMAYFLDWLLPRDIVYRLIKLKA